MNPYYYAEKLDKGELSVSIYGLGYVGLTLSAVWIKAGAKVIGVDINSEKVKAINKGKIFSIEKSIKDRILKGLKDGRFKALKDGVKASKLSDVKFVCIPVKVNKKGNLILSSLEKACISLAKGLKEKSMVVIESSLPPTTTEKVVKPLIEEHSNLKAGKDFLLAYSPERIFIGRAVEDIEKNHPKIVSGIDELSRKAIKILYERICEKGVIEVSSISSAEFIKVAQGVYRYVNIALANEMAKLCHKLSLDFNEIAKITNLDPHADIHRAGVGVGGICLPSYNLFLIDLANKHGLNLSLLKEARKVNLFMPRYTAQLVKEIALKLNSPKPKICILGLAFRGDIDDPRLSPTYDLIRELKHLKFNGLMVHDPYIDKDEFLRRKGIPLSSKLEKVLRNSDIVIIATDHSLYKSLSLEKIKSLSGKKTLGIIDGRNILDFKELPKGVAYVSIGRPLVSKL